MSTIRSEHQELVADWVSRTFGTEKNVPERARRLLEESIEVFQALGMQEAGAHDLVRHVFAKPPGRPSQELGGVFLTLLALCDALAVDAGEIEWRELRRVLAGDPAEFRRRQREKAEAGVGLRPDRED